MIRLSAVLAMAMVVCLLGATLLAHEIKGTVVSASRTSVTITVVDETTRKPGPITFDINKDTKIFRGKKAVTFTEARMKWITREHVKVDRVACPWLITRFVEPGAEFIFVPADQVAAKARELGATPFDIDGCELGHHGEDVSFNSILKKYDLVDPALALLGEIVRAADSDPPNPHPAGEGLRWVASGFKALGLDDHEILRREFIVYDALFAECKKRT